MIMKNEHVDIEPSKVHELSVQATTVAYKHQFSINTPKELGQGIYEGMLRTYQHGESLLNGLMSMDSSTPPRRYLSPMCAPPTHSIGTLLEGMTRFIH